MSKWTSVQSKVDVGGRAEGALMKVSTLSKFTQVKFKHLREFLIEGRAGKLFPETVAGGAKSPRRALLRLIKESLTQFLLLID